MRVIGVLLETKLYSALGGADTTALTVLLLVMATPDVEMLFGEWSVLVCPRHGLS